MIECSAEPSVLAGVESSPEYLLNTNLVGTLNCLESVRKNKSAIIFLSTSRVYPIKTINSLPFIEESTRHSLKKGYNYEGISDKGISEEFPLIGPRSLYGTTKLCSELIIQEYAELYDIQAVINRCGLISGPWQMGKIDQGVIMLWILNQILKRDLTYIGYGGEGKQVRDVLHIEDLCRLIEIQITDLHLYKGEIYNVGGGIVNSISLFELTEMCEEITGNRIKISKIPDTRPNDLIWYITDSTKIMKKSGWTPQKRIHELLYDMKNWIISNKESLSNIL